LTAIVGGRGQEETEWVFWCTSDRYPWLVERSALLNEIAAELGSPAFADCDAVKLARWREDENITAFREMRNLGGMDFELREAGLFGFWHHHFIRLAELKRLIDSVPSGADIRQLQAKIREHLKHTRWREALPTESLVKFHEPLFNNQATLNYELERRARKLDADRREISSRTMTFVSPSAPKENYYWQKRKQSADEVLTRRTRRQEFAVFSSGGVGSKLLVKWLLGPVLNGRRYNKAHYHWRLPPLRLRNGQRAIYMFGDPRDAIVSFFQRRISRHERHGFDSAILTREDPAPDWAISALRNIEADSPGFSPRWSLPDYLDRKRDYFRLEEHFDFWLGAKRDYDVYFVKYEGLWESFDTLSKIFCLTPRAIPERVPRRANWRAEPPEVQLGLNALYGRFAERLAALPNVFVQRGGRSIALEDCGDPSANRAASG
jgi:hypothetical protein